MYAFQLGREYKLSIAEIYALFPTAVPVHIDEKFCILNITSREEIVKKAQHMGGVIKIIEIQKNISDVSKLIAEKAQTHEGKFRYGLSVFGNAKRNENIRSLLMNMKKALKSQEISARFVNKNFENLSSAQVIAEGLVQRNSDFNIIHCSPLGRGSSPKEGGGGENTIYIGHTIWIQDINAYSERDYGKTRDMLVGMLPPKLAQIMINIGASSLLGGDKGRTERSDNSEVKAKQNGERSSKRENIAIYDPFCGLGTILIESILMGNNEIYGSDISPENIEKTKKNINYTRKNFENSVKTADTLVLDAKGISSSKFLKKSHAIVTEGYLGTPFLPHSVSVGKINEVKKELIDIYTHFFKGLQKANFTKPIVISFPFWEIQGKYFYFTEIYEVIKEHGKTLPLLPRMDDIKHTKSGSLLYKRPGQVVGREIFKIKVR